MTAPQPPDADYTTWALGALAGLLLVGAVLWGGAATACVIAGGGVPEGGLVSALTAVTNPGDPAAAWPQPGHVPGAAVYWTCTAFVTAMGVAATLVGLKLYRRVRTEPGRVTARRLRSLPGAATPLEADRGTGRRALLARTAQVRPSLTGRTAPELVGYRIGMASGRGLWCSVEDSALLLGPPRMGKGLHVVIPWILDAPGAVVATSTRPDTLAVTLRARQRIGPVAVFDPQALAGLPGGLRWSPVRGCQSPRTALVRARGMAAGTGLTAAGASDGDFWRGQTESVLRCLLHAAALDGRRAGDLYRWSLDPVLASDAVTVLTRHPNAAQGWADALDAAISSDPRTRDSIWLGVRQSLAALSDPAVLASVDPDPTTGDEFDPARFLREKGTMFVLASAVASGSCGPLVAALVEDITETARTLAAASPGARLDPPLLLALDEVANLTPLPSLPSLMAEGGGSGITTLTVLQSLSQARHRWGDHAADAIWDASTVKIILGGLGRHRDLEDVSRLLGEVDEPTLTRTRGRAGERSSSTGVRTVPVMPPSVLRTLPFGTAVLLLRQIRPIVVDLHPWTHRHDAAVLTHDKHAIETDAAHHATNEQTAVKQVAAQEGTA